MVKLEMEVDGLPDNETDMVNPDFALVAQAMGFKGITISKPEDAETSISEALKENGPILLNILTNPSALAMPPKIEWAQMKGMALSMSKLMLGGKMEEVFDTIKSNYKHLSEVL
jgi:pyruvate dehydrogenase (quinone)